MAIAVPLAILALTHARLVVHDVAAAWVALPALVFEQGQAVGTCKGQDGCQLGVGC